MGKAMQKPSQIKQELADVKAGIPVHDAEIETLRKENAELREQLEAIGAGGVNGKLMPGAVCLDQVRVVAWRARDGHGLPQTDWIDGDPGEETSAWVGGDIECAYSAPASAQAQPMKVTSYEAIDWTEISKRGLLERINREIMHPLGLAVYRCVETGVSGGALVSPDGVWTYEEDSSQEQKPASGAGGLAEAITDAVMQVYHRTPVGDALDYSDIYDAVKAVLAAPVAAQAQPDLIRFDYVNTDGRPDSKMLTHDEMRERYAALAQPDWRLIQKGDQRIINGQVMTCTDPEIGRWQGSGPQQPVSGADELTAFEASGLTHNLRRNDTPGLNHTYADAFTEELWSAWKARAALAQQDAGKVDAERYVFLRDYAGQSWAGWIDQPNEERSDQEVDESIREIKERGEWLGSKQGVREDGIKKKL